MLHTASRRCAALCARACARARTQWHSAAALPRSIAARADSDAAQHNCDAHDVVCARASRSPHATLTLCLSGHGHILEPNSAAAERAQFALLPQSHGWHSRGGAAPERAIALAGQRRCGAMAHVHAAAARRTLAFIRRGNNAVAPRNRAHKASCACGWALHAMRCNY